jgi:hypothetical protein
VDDKKQKIRGKIAAVTERETVTERGWSALRSLSLSVTVLVPRNGLEPLLALLQTGF